jgi:hypothetical protein
LKNNISSDWTNVSHVIVDDFLNNGCQQASVTLCVNSYIQILLLTPKYPISSRDDVLDTFFLTDITTTISSKGIEAG